MPKVPKAKKPKQPDDKVKRCASAKNWLFTWNNYPDDAYEKIGSSVSKFQGMRWIAGKEVGEKEGTPHLQGAVFWQTKFRPMEKLKLPQATIWTACAGTIEENIAYCTKDGDYKANFVVKESLPPEPEFVPYGWQLPLVEVANQVPNRRHIHWIWSDKGEVGKSIFAKWLIVNCRWHAIMVGGKAADMKKAVCDLAQNGTEVGLCVLDIPRSVEHVSWGGLEEIKNGCFFSSKYEGGQVVVPSPHLFVFSNFAPDLDNGIFSKDRIVEHCLEFEIEKIAAAARLQRLGL